MDTVPDVLRAQLAAAAAAHTPYEELEQGIRGKVSGSLYRQALLLHSFRERARYDTEFHGSSMGLVDEQDYYNQMIEWLRQSLSLYPHQLSDVVAGRLRISPFDYYSSMLVEVIRSDSAYDSLPNWTAADCKRVIGVGRNEYINMMNEYRSKGWLAKQRRKTTVALLPTHPCTDEIQPEWRVCGVTVREDELLTLEDDIAHLVLHLAKQPNSSASISEIGIPAAKALYRLGLVWLDVPVSLQDRIRILPLHNFVMNKDCSGEDRYEMLLYELLVSHDQRSTAEQLAHILGAPRDMVQRAIALYLRLGFASKIDTSEEDNADKDDEDNPALPHPRRIGLLFDSQLPGILMMGNLSNALKAHAITLFEAGKLSDESMEPFLTELSQLPTNPEHADPDDASYLYACALRSALVTLRHNSACTTEGSDGGVDILRVDSLHALGELRKHRVLSHQYSILMSLSPLDPKVWPVATPSSVVHFGPVTAGMHEPWLKLWLYQQCGFGPMSWVYPRGTVLRRLPASLRNVPHCLMHPWGEHQSAHPTGVMLMQLNEALVDGPVAVHALHSEEVVDVALPLTDEGTTNPDQDLAHVLETIRTKVEIGRMMGHMRMVRLKDGWIPLDLVLGLPMHCLHLNSEVLEAIQANQLLTCHLDQSRAVTDQLSTDLDGFIKVHAGYDADTAPFMWSSSEHGDSQLTWPREIMHFDGRRFATETLDG